MSELELEQIYSLFKSPMEKQLVDMRNQIARSRFQKDVDTKLDVGSLGINSQNYLKFVNDWYHLQNHTIGTVNYYPAFEPDYDLCKLWINTDHFGYKMEDDSLIPALNPVTDPVDPENPQIQIPRYPVGQDITCYGEPTLSNGFDRGYGDMTQSRKMQALHFNRPNSPTRFGEYMQVLDQAVDQPNKTLRVTDASVGQTWIIRIKSTDTFNPQPTGSYSQTLISKIDADDGNNAVLIYLGSSGRCVFQIRKAGVDYAVYHADVYPAIGTEYEYALVWNPAGATTNDKMHIYLNGVLKTNTNNTPTSYGDATKHDLYIGRRGGYNDGYFTGNIILVKYFHNFLATDANILSHYNNKLTIAGGIDYGHVAVINYMTPQNS